MLEIGTPLAKHEGTDRKEGHLCRNETSKALEDICKAGPCKWRATEQSLSSEDILTTGHLYVSPSSVWLYFNSITTEDDL